MGNCVFCDIIAKKIPSKVIFENETTIAFLSSKADVSGHLLVIPKDHSSNLNEITEESFLEMQKTILLINQHLITRCGYTGVNLLMASGESAGQSVQHVHMHLIPRNSDDGIDAWPKLAEKLIGTSDELYQKLKLS